MYTKAGAYAKPDSYVEEPLTNGVTDENIDPSSSTNTTSAIDQSPQSQSISIDTTARPPSSPAVRTMSLPDEQPQEAENAEPAEQQILTAIYRPDSKAAWREELRAANEKAENVSEHLPHSANTQVQNERSRAADQSDEEQLANLTLNVDEEEVKPSDSLDRTWTSRRSLKGHLDIVRCVAFAHGPGIMLATGGDDNTVKVWSVEASSIMSQK